jgi:DNA-damage-inducible protein J
MSNADTCVRVRINTLTKDRAIDALEAMGLSIPNSIRLLMRRLADGRRLLFDVRVPNTTTWKAMAEAEGIIKARRARFNSSDGKLPNLLEELSK